VPSYAEVLAELERRMGAAPERGVQHLDDFLLESMAQTAALSSRPTILYATRWMQGSSRPDMVSIGLDDVHGLMGVLQGLPGPALDIILHSPGGSPTAAEAVVSYLRTKFSDIRVIVPLAAMSAGTMLACAANRIIMGKHSFLGPTDPQMLLETPLGLQSVPADAILRQFNMALEASKDPTKFAAYLPMLQQYGPALLVQAENSLQLTQLLVSEWLRDWMFAGEPDAEAKAELAAEHLNKHGKHLNHGRYLPRQVIRGFGLKVDELETDQAFQDAVLTVFHCITHAFNLGPNLQKVILNHQGNTYFRSLAPEQAPLPPSIPAPPSPPA
jgi:hypothetical protein